MRALIVDDSRAVRAMIGRIVRELGFSVVEAGNGAEALARLAESGTADVALVDWNMPEMNGVEFVVAARAVPAYASMRIVMVTSESEMGRVASALDAGANEYLMKPFDAEALREKLALVGVGAA
ncbi:MAG: response regulator [Gemmatimonadaceae bacterium]|nr:response regulator [Gemmatimonadaceae bacterium]